MYKCPIREDFCPPISGTKNHSKLTHWKWTMDRTDEPILLQGHLLLFDIGILHFVAVRLFFVCLASKSIEIFTTKHGRVGRIDESAGNAKTTVKSHTTTIYQFITLGGFLHFSESTLVTNDSISNVFMNTWVLQHPRGASCEGGGWQFRIQVPAVQFLAVLDVQMLSSSSSSSSCCCCCCCWWVT